MVTPKSEYEIVKALWCPLTVDGDRPVNEGEEDPGGNRVTANLVRLLLSLHDELVLVSKSMSCSIEDLV